MLIDVAKFIKSLGFGAMLGSGLLMLIHELLPNMFNPETSKNTIAFIGALIGAGIHQLLHELVVNSILKPFSRFTTYYSHIVQITLLRPIIGDNEADHLVRKLTAEHFHSAEELIDTSKYTKQSQAHKGANKQRNTDSGADAPPPVR